MKRSLCKWLASFALLIAPGTVSAQTFLGHTRLAPVALEARGLLSADALPNFSPSGAARLAALGADPLHAAILEADLHPAAPAPKSDASDQVAPCPMVAQDCAAEHAAPQEPATSGPSPTIVTLTGEEYLPYDLVNNPPLNLRWTTTGSPRACVLLQQSAVSDATDVVAEADRPTSTAVQAWDLSQWVPSADQLRNLRRTVQSMKPRLPLDCWMDETIRQTTDLMAADGPVRQALAPENVGGEIARLSLRAVENVDRVAEPALPQIARWLPDAPPAQAIAAEDYELAAGVLQSTASGLESLANRLRQMSSSLSRVAAQERAAMLR